MAAAMLVLNRSAPDVARACHSTYSKLSDATVDITDWEVYVVLYGATKAATKLALLHASSSYHDRLLKHESLISQATVVYSPRKVVYRRKCDGGSEVSKRWLNFER